MTEQFANNASSTLNGTITNVQTTLVVSSAALFPSVPQFRIIIDSEIMLVTGVSGTTFTVSRGVENTAQTTHNTGATVNMILTAAALAQFQLDTIQSVSQVGSFSNIPSAGIAGRVYRVTNGSGLFVDDGTNWRPVVNDVLCTQPPSVSSLTWVNQVSCTATNTNGSILFTCPTEVGANFHGLSKTGAGSSAEAAAVMLGNGPNTAEFDYSEWGVYLRESSTGKIAMLSNWVQMDNNSYTISSHITSWTNNTTRTSATGGLASGFGFGVTVFMRARVSGANVVFERSLDGSNWFQCNGSPIAKTTFFTTGPDESGIVFMGGFSTTAGFTETCFFKHVILT